MTRVSALASCSGTAQAHRRRPVARADAQSSRSCWSTSGRSRPPSTALKVATETPDSRSALRALPRHVAFEERPGPGASNGLMPLVAARIAYRAVRNRGTIGGAIALADPGGRLATALLALEAQIALVGPNGRRTMPIADFVTGPYSTALGPAELIEAVEVPRRAATERWGRCKVVRKTGEYRGIRWRSP